MSFFDWIKDISRISDFKKQIGDLNEQVKKLKNKNKELRKKVNFKLSAEAMSLVEINDKTIDKNKELKELEIEIEDKKDLIKQLLDEISYENHELEDLRAEVGDLTSESKISEYGLFNPNYEFENSWQYKERLKEIRDEQKSLVKNKQAVHFNPNWTVNNKKSLGRKMNNNQIKAILRSFNNECTEAIKKANFNNYDRVDARIDKSFSQLNKMYSVIDIQLTENYLNLKHQELDIAFKYECKKQEEKEELQEQRRIERENAALKREAEKQKKQIQKDIDHYNKAIKELEARSKVETENQGLKDEIAKLKQEIQSKDIESNDLDSQVYNAKAGYVYIISNIGSFGDDIVKIGVTRRLKPEERVSELSSASVPFKFDTHAFIYSSDAFDLEKRLHDRFSDQRVNMVNNHKEFFHISIKDIEEELKKYDNVTVDFNEYPEADEYRQTVKIEEENNKNNKVEELLAKS